MIVAMLLVLIVFIFLLDLINTDTKNDIKSP